MKIVLINARYFPDIHGGGDKSTQFLAEGLVDAGHDVVVIATSKNNQYQEYIHNGVKVIKIRLWNLYWFPPEKPQNKFKKALWHTFDIYNPFMGRSVRKVLLIEKPDLIHSQALDGFSPSVWKAACRLSIPIVHTLRGYKLLCPKATMFKNEKNCQKQCLPCSMYSFFQRPISHRVDALIGISRFVMNKHLKSHFFKRTPIQTRIFNAFKPETSIQDLQGNSSEILRIGYFGRIHNTKGIESIIESLESLPTDKYEFFIGGNGDPNYINELKEKLENKPAHFLGHVTPEDFFPSIDILLVLSRWHEPLGRVVLESFSFGVPVIGSDRGGIPEMISEGRNGFIVNPENITEIAAKLRDLIESENIDYLKENALKSSENYLPEKIIEEHIDIYNQLTGQ